MHTRRFFLSLMMLAALLFVGAASARAQEQLTLETLTIEVWPEFDQPSVLVLYNGEVAGEPAEVTLTFTMPEGATFNAAAYVDTATGDLLTAQSSIEGDQVTLTSPNGTFHVEFYDPALSVEGNERSYSFTWAGDYAVNSLTWEIQEPPQVDGFAVEPEALAPETRRFDLRYHNIVRAELEADETDTISLAYEKTWVGVTVDQLQPAEESAPVDTSPETESTGSSIDSSTVLISVLAIVGLGLIGGGLYWYNRTREEDDEAPAPRTRSTPRKAVSGGAGRFCTQCGTPSIDAEDKFCRKCGAKLRV